MNSLSLYILIVELALLPFIASDDDTNQSSVNQTIPGKLTSPYPTIHNLAVEWFIQGDDNQNGVVSVHFREKGKKEWRDGMPLRRVPADKNVSFSWANKHSGSIFNLQSNTRYEIKLQLTDPDGGAETKFIEASTRPIPQYGNNSEIIDLPPGNYDTLHTKSGTKMKPMVYRSNEEIAKYKFVDLRNKKWVFIEKIQIENVEEGGRAIRMGGAEHCVVRYCTIKAVYGIVAYLPGARNCYVSDNVITGTSGWTNKAMGAHGENIGEGIQMTGPGNVICYNKVTGFRDCISTMEDQQVFEQTCIDIHNNDVFRGSDDGIEADFCFSNCRIYNNRLTNCYVGLSSQPGLGGPTYFIRNSMYNIVHAAFKLKRKSIGDVILHNTVVKVGTGLGGNSAVDYAYFRNNLAIGGPTGGVNWGNYGAGNPYAADVIEPGVQSSFDYDAVGVEGVPYVAKIGGEPFSNVEKHGIEQIDINEVFRDVEFPNPPVPEREVADLRPVSGSRVTDVGLRIPNINDNYEGDAPDCGAYESGQKLPHYGPRL